jgi:hypothetical protein
MKKCSKMKHSTTFGAAQHIKNLMDKKKNKGKFYSIYFHGECEAYHISERILNTSLSLIIAK